MSVVQHFDLSSPDDEHLELAMVEPKGSGRKDLSEKELRSYAKYLGIREKEYDALKPLAEEGLSAPLPSDWVQCRTPEKGKRRFYYNARSERSQWEHPLDSTYKDKVRVAQRKESQKRRPKVLGDVTNKSRESTPKNAKGKAAAKERREKKILPPLRLAPIDVSTRDSLDSGVDLSEQNPLYLEQPYLGAGSQTDSESGTISTTVSTATLASASESASVSRSKARSLRQRSRRRNSKQSPREMRMREASASEQSASRSFSTTPVGSESSSSTRGRGPKKGQRNLAPLSRAGPSSAQEFAASPSSSSSSTLAPRTPGNGLKKKKGSPRRIEKLNDNRIRTGQAADNDSKESVHGVGASNPLQLQLVIDVEEEEKATKGDIKVLKRLQSDAFSDLKHKVAEMSEKCLAELGGALSAKAERSAVIDKDQDALLQQLKGEIDLISDYYSKDGQAKKDREARLAEEIAKFKNRLTTEHKRAGELEDSLEAAKEEKRREGAYLSATIESQKREIVALMERVAEANKLAESFNATAAGQGKAILARLDDFWATFQENQPTRDTQPAPDGTLVLGDQVKDVVREEAGALSCVLSAELAKKFDALSESLVSAQACHSGKMDKVLEDIKSAAMQVEGAAVQREEETGSGAGNGAAAAPNKALNVLGDMRAVANQLEASIKEQESLYKRDKDSNQLVLEQMSEIKASLQSLGSPSNRKESKQSMAAVEEGNREVRAVLADLVNTQGDQSREQQEALASMLEAALASHQQKLQSDQENFFSGVSESLANLSESVAKVGEDTELQRGNYLNRCLSISTKSTGILMERLDSISEHLSKQGATERLVLHTEGCQTDQNDVARSLQRKSEDTEAAKGDDGISVSTSPLLEYSDHSKKQLELLKLSLEKGKAKERAVKMLTRQGKDKGWRPSLMHNFEAYLQGLHASSNLTQDICKRLKKKGKKYKA